jgi:hypothetical protein
VWPTAGQVAYDHLTTPFDTPCHTGLFANEHEHKESFLILEIFQFTFPPNPIRFFLLQMMKFG